MNNLWYSFRELKNSWVFKVIIVIQITIATILLYRVNEIKNYEYGKLNLIEAITKNKTIYSIMPKYGSSGEMMEDTAKVDKFTLFSNAVQEKYNLVTVTTGGVFMKDFINIDKVIDTELAGFNYGEGYKPINSLQCSFNFFDTFDMKLSQGDLSEFINYTKLDASEMEGKVIPAVLGDAYRGVFKQNDVIKTKFNTLKVVAFLEKNQFYLDKGVYEPSRARNLSTFIILPSPHDIVVANITNALLVSDNSKTNDFYSIQKDIEELSKEYNVKISISNPKENIDSFVDMISYNANIKILIVYIVMFFVVVGLIAIFSNRINARRKEFSIHIMHGATYNEIYIRVLLEHLYLLVLSVVIAFYYLQKTKSRIIIEVINFDLGAFQQTMIIIFSIIFIVAMVPIYNISKNRLNYLIKGE